MLPPWGTIPPGFPELTEEVFAAVEDGLEQLANDPNYIQPHIQSVEESHAFPRPEERAQYEVRYTPFGPAFVMRQRQALDPQGFPEELLTVDFAYAADPTGPRIVPMPFVFWACTTGRWAQEEYGVVHMTSVSKMLTIHVRAEEGVGGEKVGEVHYFTPTVKVDEERIRMLRPNV